MAHLGEIWNAAASAINTVIEVERIWTPPRFALHRLWARIPDRALEAAEWTLEIDPAAMPEVFEVVFRGLNVVRQRCHGP